MAYICPDTGLTRYTLLDARLETNTIRRHVQEHGTADDPRHETSFRQCRSCKGYHVIIPEKRQSPLTKNHPDAPEKGGQDHGLG